MRFLRNSMQKSRRIHLPLLLLTLFLAYQASITMFSHIHYINGVMIVHSHPSTDNQHTHTEGQILTMANISSFDGVEPVSYVIPDSFLPVLFTLVSCRDGENLPSYNNLCLSLRAPPFFS